MPAEPFRVLSPNPRPAGADRGLGRLPYDLRDWAGGQSATEFPYPNLPVSNKTRATNWIMSLGLDDDERRAIFQGMNKDVPLQRDKDGRSYVTLNAAQAKKFDVAEGSYYLDRPGLDPQTIRVGLTQLGIGLASGGAGVGRVAEELFGRAALRAAARGAAEGAAYETGREGAESIAAKKNLMDPGAIGTSAIAGMGLRLGAKAVGDWIIHPGTKRVYHGSVSKFDKFDSSKIGTGEGTQWEGYGHYLTESKKVADWYTNMLGSGPFKSKTHTVRVKVDPAKLIDLAKPLSQQPELIQSAFRQLGINDMEMTGDEAMRAVGGLAGPKRIEVASKLKAMGIHGTTYPDPDISHVTGALGMGHAAPVQNYVIFDDNLMKVIDEHSFTENMLTANARAGSRSVYRDQKHRAPPR